LLGRRRILMLGLAVFTGASLGAGLATSGGFLITMRGLQGLGAAAVHLTAALSIVMNMFPEGAEHNKALGLWGAIGAVGATVGVIAGGLLTRYAGWEYIFLLNVPIGAAALLLALRLVSESGLQGVRRWFDPLGAVTVTGALLLLVYTISNAPQAGWGSARTVTLLAVSAALLLAFLMIESRSAAPLMPLRIFRLRAVAVANTVGLLLFGSFFAFIFIGALYMQQVLGYSALPAGLAWLAASVTSVTLAGLAQMLVTRFSAGPVMAAGTAHRRSVQPGQHDHRNLSRCLGLEFAERRSLRDQLRPQFGAGGMTQLLRQNRERLATHLDGDPGVGLEVVVPVWVGWRSPIGGHDGEAALSSREVAQRRDALGPGPGTEVVDE
jgi:MFS family permease